MGKMGRRAWFDANGLKRGAWSQEEDYKLRSYILRYGHWNWRQLPKFAGLSRCGKSCRLRWLNYLRKDIKRGNFSKEEEDLIIALRDKHGNKWADIASKLPGRTDNEVKNYWHSKLKKRVQENSIISNYVANCSNETLLPDEIKGEYNDVLDTIFVQTKEELGVSASSSPVESLSPFSESSSGDANGFPSLDFDYDAVLNDIYWPTDYSFDNSFEAYSEPTVENFWTQPFLFE